MQVEALVDTGALHTMIPESVSEFLHMEHEAHQEFELADGELVAYPVGGARIKIMERSMICPVIFGPEDQYIVGATTLETLGFAVDPTEEKLVNLNPRQARPV